MSLLCFPNICNINYCPKTTHIYLRFSLAQQETQTNKKDKDKSSHQYDDR